MKQYISKSALVAEIKRRRKEIPKNETDKTLKTVYGNEAFVLTELLSFLDTLEVKEVEEPSKNLEEAAKFYAATHTEFFDSECKPHVAPAFIAGAKWHKEQLKDKGE